MDRIIIVLNKGNVEEVITERRADVFVLDNDIEGAEEPDVGKATVYEKEEEFWWKGMWSRVDKGAVARIAKQLLAG